MTVGAGLALHQAPWALLAFAGAELVCYLALTQSVKMLLLRRRWI